jgi:Fe-S cluster biogenesis protein NfuA
MPASNEVDRQLKSIEALIRKVEEATDPALAATARELVQALMELHGSGLERMLGIVDQAGPDGASTIAAFGRDDLVRSLLLLYGIHPEALETRVIQALEKIRPYLQSHGAAASLVRVDDSGSVTLRLDGQSHGCGSSPAALKLAIEEAIYEAAPDVLAIATEGSIREESSAAAFVPLSQLISTASNGPIRQPERVQSEVTVPASTADRSDA